MITRWAIFWRTACVLLGVTLAMQAAAQTFVAGRDYTVLPGKVQTASGDKAEIVEFFLYSCEHCDVFEPILQAWARKLPDNVVLRRIPVPLGPAGSHYARIFYTAQALAMPDRFHQAIFNAIHRQGRLLLADEAVRSFFVAQGALAPAFDAAYNSPDMDSRITQGALLAQLYGVTTVPSIGVNGRFWINSRQAQTYQRFLKIADYLANTGR